MWLKFLLASVDKLQAELRQPGFADEDPRDIGAITALFCLSYRILNLPSMQPNNEFYLIGRAPMGELAVEA